jgi:hypothetical protein
MMIGVMNDDATAVYWYDVPAAQYGNLRDIGNGRLALEDSSISYDYHYVGDPAAYRGESYANFRGYNGSGGYANTSGYNNRYGYYGPLGYARYGGYGGRGGYGNRGGYDNYSGYQGGTGYSNYGYSHHSYGHKGRW